MTVYGSNVHFFFDDVKAELRERLRLKTFLHQICRDEKKKLYQLSVIFCSDEALLQMNRDYLNHDYYTDIISFDLSADVPGISGELYISVDRVKENAHQIGHTFKKELHRVIFHGLLHLCGYGDKTDEEQQQMRSKEDLYLNQYFS